MSKVQRTGRHNNTARILVYAALTSALAALLLAAGYYLQLMEFFWYFAAAMCMMVASVIGGIRTALMAYASSVLLSMLLCAFNFFFLLPYVLFMGLHPIANAAIVRYRISPVIAHPIKAAWFCVWLLLMVRFTGLFLFINLSVPLVPLLIVAIGLPVYILYDLAVRLVSKSLARRLRRFVVVNSTV
jgi:hypothetical protein